MTPQQLKDKISRAFARYLGVTSNQGTQLIPSGVAGKVYEAYVLSLVARDLVTKEGCQLRLNRGSRVQLKSSVGPINRAYPHIQVSRGGMPLGEMWTDVAFLSLSFWRNPQSATPTKGDVHELDILLTVPRAAAHPTPKEILMGIECKHTAYERRLLREILGVRRELSLLSDATPTAFKSWPRPTVPADPPSCLLVYSSSPAITSYAAPGVFSGINFLHQPV